MIRLVLAIITQAGGALTIDGGLNNDGQADIVLQGGRGDESGGVLLIAGTAGQLATVTLDGLVVQGGSALEGGGIYARYANLSLNHSIIRDNLSYRAGGGLFGLRTSITIEDSQISGNRGGSGGGISAFHSPLAISGSSIDGNAAVGQPDTGSGQLSGVGGGISAGGSSFLTLVDSTK